MLKKNICINKDKLCWFYYRDIYWYGKEEFYEFVRWYILKFVIYV